MEYKKVKLGEVCRVNQGLQIPISKRFKENGKNRYFYITIQFLKGNTEEYYIENPPKNVRCMKEDILVVRTGSTGIVLTNVEGCFHNNFFKVVPNNNIYNKYLYYSLNNSKMYREMLNAASGTTIPDLKHSAFYELEIYLPSIDIQKKIANILDNINKKIELNNQINDNLHKLSDELYKGWFIDYNYPNSNGKLKESSLGLIPEDWRVERLENVAECQNGYAFYKDGYDEDGIMVIDLGNINLNSTFIYTNADKYIRPDRVETDKFNKYKVYKNDLIMVMTDRKATMELLGKTGKIFEDKEFLLNQRMYRIRSKINTNYLYTALNNDLVLNKLKSKALGSVQKYVNTGHINELDILIGTDEVMKNFSKMVNPIYAEIENRTIENTRLENLRDLLLQKLMSGEIDLDKIEI